MAFSAPAAERTVEMEMERHIQIGSHTNTDNDHDHDHDHDSGNDAEARRSLLHPHFSSLPSSSAPSSLNSLSSLIPLSSSSLHSHLNSSTRHRHCDKHNQSNQHNQLNQPNDSNCELLGNCQCDADTCHNSSSSNSSSSSSSILHSISVRLFPLRAHKWKVAFSICMLLLAITLCYVRITNKCSMEGNLLNLFVTAINAFSSTDARWFIDYGTLLGYMREHTLIPWEFDLDIAAPIEECDKLIALRPIFEAQGMKMYLPGEWIPMKYNWLLGFDGYLHKACLRVYDRDLKYYFDVDWYRTFEPEQVDTAVIIPPNDWNPSSVRRLMCNEEAWVGHGGDAGGCRYEDEMLPLQRRQWYGSTIYIPADPEASLRRMYGPNWQIPTPKGYKILICSWLPHTDGMFYLLVCWLIIGVPFTLWLLDRHRDKWSWSRWKSTTRNSKLDNNRTIERMERHAYE